MAAQVVPLFQRLRPHYDWTPRELAQFYRVESALIQAGLQLETDRGLTDEGDPWFVFCRAENGEVFIHFARIGGQYIAVGAALDQVIQGKDFPTLVQEMLAAQAWAMAKTRNQPGQSNVFLHPSALLIALVGAAFFHSGDAKASDLSHAVERAGGARRFALPILLQESGDLGAQPLGAAETATILSGVLIALGQAPVTAPLDLGAASSALLVGASDPVAPPPQLQPAALDGAGLSIQAAAPSVDPNAIQTALDLLQSHQAARLAGDFTLARPEIGAGGVAVFAVTPTIGAAETAAPHFDLSTPLANVNVLLLQTASTDAAQVIQSSDVLGYVSPSPSSAPVQPPAILSEQIKNGEHVLILEGSGAGGSSNGAPPSTTTGEHAPSPAPEPPSAPSATTGAPPELPANSPIVTAAITQFASEVSALDVSYSGREVILYDAALLHPVGPGTQLDSVTFNFADGSSISLVGTAAELQGLHLPFPVG